MNYDIENIFQIAKNKYKLDLNGTHGISHWERVWKNGKILSKLTSVNIYVVELFSFLHDCCRENENKDQEHGPRAAKFVQELIGSDITGNDSEINQLIVAIRDHTRNEPADDITIGTCWDSDRLDFGRISKIYKPKKQFLSTDAAKDDEIIEKAFKRSLPELF